MKDRNRDPEVITSVYGSLGRKVMTNLDSIFKSRDITLPTKVHLVKGFMGSQRVGHD